MQGWAYRFTLSKCASAAVLVGIFHRARKKSFSLKTDRSESAKQPFSYLCLRRVASVPHPHFLCSLQGLLRIHRSVGVHKEKLLRIISNKNGPDSNDKRICVRNGQRLKRFSKPRNVCCSGIADVIWHMWTTGSISIDKWLTSLRTQGWRIRWVRKTVHHEFKNKCAGKARITNESVTVAGKVKPQHYGSLLKWRIMHRVM